MPGRRTSIAARASSRWTSPTEALERARTRVHARCGGRRELAPRHISRSNRRRVPVVASPEDFSVTVREAFGEWLPAISRDALSRARENVPPANATRDVSRSRSGPPATTAPDVSVATLAKVRAWVRAWRAKTKASDLTRLVGGEGRDVEKNEKNKFTKNNHPDSVFVSTNARAAARACADPLGAPQSRYAGYVTRCAHLALGAMEATRTKPGTSRRKPVDGSCARDAAPSSRRKRRRENKRAARRVCFLSSVSRRVSRSSADSVRPLRERVPRVRIARPAVGDDRPIDSGGGDDVRLLRLFTEGKKKSKPEPERRKNRKRIRNSRATEDARVSRDDVRRRRSTEEDGVGPCHDIKRGPFRNFRAFFHRVRARSSRVRVPGRGGRPRLGRVA